MSEFTDSLPEDLRDSPALQDFKDIGGLAKSFIDTQKQALGSVSIPGDMATKADWDKFYSKTGRPENADGYEIGAPSSLPNGYEYSADGEAAFKATALDAGLSAKQAEAMYKHHMSSSVQAHSSQSDASKQARMDAQGALQEKWQGNYEKNLSASIGAIERFFGDEAEGLKAIVSKSAAMTAAFAEIGQAMGEDQNSGNRGGGNMSISVDDAWTQIKEAQADPKSAYRDKYHPGHKEEVARVQKLFEITAKDITDQSNV